MILVVVAKIRLALVDVSTLEELVEVLRCVDVQVAMEHVHKERFAPARRSQKKLVLLVQLNQVEDVTAIVAPKFGTLGISHRLEIGSAVRKVRRWWAQWAAEPNRTAHYSKLISVKKSWQLKVQKKAKISCMFVYVETRDDPLFLLRKRTCKIFLLFLTRDDPLFLRKP